MGKDKEDKSQNKANWFDGLKSEFHKIIWPTQESVWRQTLAVVLITVVLSVLIAVIDTGAKYGIDFLMNLNF